MFVHLFTFGANKCVAVQTLPPRIFTTKLTFNSSLVSCRHFENPRLPYETILV